MFPLCIGATSIGVDAIVQHIAASDEPYLVEAALLQWFMLGPCFLRDEGWGDVANRNVLLGWVHQYPLVLQLVAHGLLEVKTSPVELRYPDLEWRSLVLLPEGEGGLVRGLWIPEATSHVLVEGRVVTLVKTVQSVELLSCEHVSVYLYLREGLRG